MFTKQIQLNKTYINASISNNKIAKQAITPTIWHPPGLVNFPPVNTFFLVFPLSLTILPLWGSSLVAPPETPEGLQLLQVTSRQITFSWTAPSSGNSPITGYIIVYNQTRSKCLLFSLKRLGRGNQVFLWVCFCGIIEILCN